MILEPDENAVLEIKDVFVNSGKLYLIDNSNNIYKSCNKDFRSRYRRECRICFKV